MRKILPLVALASALSFPACESFGQAMTAHTDVVARAAGHELSVDQAASIMEANPRVPAQPQVVDALANLWVDYTLAATAASEDSTLKSVDMSALVKPALEQDMVWKLRDKVIHVDTTMSDAELEKLYEQEQPGLQVRARHILFRLPPDATPAQRDSIMKLAQQVRAKIVAGGDFAQLAKQYSEDPGSKSQGGELGFFGKGQMVPPFEEAAFKLQPGQVSDIVETPFGLHIIQVEERKLPPFAQVKDQFRKGAVGLKEQQAEEAYVKQLTDPKKIEVQNGAYDVARDLAKKPDQKLSGRAADRALVSYTGGAVTAQEFQDLMRALNQARREQFAGATDDQLKNVLEGLARNEILVAEAERQGLKPTPQAADSLTNAARTQLAGALSQIGLTSIKPQAGETKDQAVDRKVREVLEQVVKGEQNVIPLGPLAYALREKYGAEVYERSLPNVVTKVEAARPAAPPAGSTGAAVPGAQPQATPAPSTQPNETPAPNPAGVPAPTTSH